MIPATEDENQRNLTSFLKLNFKMNNKPTTILLDADRTIYEPDTSRFLNDKANINLSEIKKGFEIGYTYNGFYLMNQIYSRIEFNNYRKYSDEIAHALQFYPGFESFIKKAEALADVVVVSSGIKAIIDSFFTQRGLSHIPRIVGTNVHQDDFLIGRNEKGLISEFFRSQGKCVIAFGDSDVDTIMLQKAHHAVVVVNHRNNQDLIPHLKKHPAVSQISFKDYFHPEIPKTSYEDFINCYPHLFSIEKHI